MKPPETIGKLCNLSKFLIKNSHLAYEEYSHLPQKEDIYLSQPRLLKSNFYYIALL